MGVYSCLREIHKYYSINAITHVTRCNHVIACSLFSDLLFSKHLKACGGGGGCDVWGRGRGWRSVNNHAVLIISICFALINVSCYDSVMQSNCVVTLCSHVQSRLDLSYDVPNGASNVPELN